MRPRPRLTLRVLLLLVAVVAVVIGWHTRGLHLRRQAIARLEAKGGVVQFNVDENGEHPGPKWLKWLIGDDAFAEVVYIALRGDAFSDEDIKLMSLFPTLYLLDVSGSSITDAGLDDISRLPTLNYLVYDAVCPQITRAKFLALVEGARFSILSAVMLPRGEILKEYPHLNVREFETFDGPRVFFDEGQQD